jgi:hypothetical protein
MHRGLILILMLLNLLFAGCARKRDIPSSTATREGKIAEPAPRNKALPEQFVWTLEPEEMIFPESRVSGSILSKPFAPD